MTQVTKLAFSSTPESDRCERLCIVGHKRFKWPRTFRVDMTWSNGKTNACDIEFEAAGASRVCMVAAKEQPYCFKFCEKRYQINPNKIEANSYKSLPRGFTVRVFGYIDDIIVFDLPVSVLVVERKQTFEKFLTKIVDTPCTHENADLVIERIGQTVWQMCAAASKKQLALSDWTLANIGLRDNVSVKIVLVDWEGTAKDSDKSDYQRANKAWRSFCIDLSRSAGKCANSVWKDVLRQVVDYLTVTWWRPGAFAPFVPAEKKFDELEDHLSSLILHLPKLEKKRRKKRKNTFPAVPKEMQSALSPGEVFDSTTQQFESAASAAARDTDDQMVCAPAEMQSAVSPAEAVNSTTQQFEAAASAAAQGTDDQMVAEREEKKDSSDEKEVGNTTRNR